MQPILSSGEILKPLPGYENKYAVSSKRRLWSYVTSRWLRLDQRYGSQVTVWVNGQEISLNLKKICAKVFRDVFPVLKNGEILKPLPGHEDIVAITNFKRVWSYRSRRWMTVTRRGKQHVCSFKVGASFHNLNLNKVCRELFGYPPVSILLAGETARDIVKCPGFVVTDLGRVISLKFNTVVGFTAWKYGFKTVILKTATGKIKQSSVAHLVARAFPEIVTNLCGFRYIKHKDGDKQNCAASNLQFHPGRGKHVGTNKFSTSMVALAAIMLKEGKSKEEIIEKTGYVNLHNLLSGSVGNHIIDLINNEQHWKIYTDWKINKIPLEKIAIDYNLTAEEAHGIAMATYAPMVEATKKAFAQALVNKMKGSKK